MKEISLTKNKVVMVDDEDYEYLNQFNWQCNINGRCSYAGRSTPRDENYKQKHILMHREILGFPDGSVDHIDHNGLNNQKNNLRICTVAENGANRRKQLIKTCSKYKGVTYHKRDQRWQTQIRFQKKRY